MEVSRLTFTKETKEKMEKGVSHFRKGELRWQKLQELEDTGKLGKARNRQDITNMMGLGTGYGAPYTWLSNMISRGSIKEILLGFDKNSKPEYEYHLTNTNRPNYTNIGKANIPTPNKIPATPAPEPITNGVTGKVYAVPTNDGTKMVIKYKDLTIEIENVDVGIVNGIIETLTNK